MASDPVVQEAVTAAVPASTAVDAGPAPDTGAAGPGTPAVAPPAAAAAKPARRPGLLDGPSEPSAPADAPSEASGKVTYRPQDLPEHLVGSDDRETIDKLSGAWKGLRDQLAVAAQKPPATPDAYKLSVPADHPAGRIPADDKAMAAFKKVAHEAGLSQATFERVVTGYFDALGQAGLLAPAQDLEQEFKALGGRDKAAPLLQGLKSWGAALQERGVLTDAEFEEFLVAGGTAQGARMLIKLRELSGEKPIPVALPPSGAESEADLFAQVADPRYHTDKAYRARVEAAFQRRYGGQNV